MTQFSPVFSERERFPSIVKTAFGWGEVWGKPVIPWGSLNFHLSPLGRLCGGVWYPRKDSCGLLSALEFSMVALERPLIGLMDFQGSQSSALPIWCQDWTLCGLLGDGLVELA